MAIRISERVSSSAPVAAAFETVRWLDRWAAFVGVRMSGQSERPIDVGDAFDVAIDVAGRTLGVRAEVVSVTLLDESGQGRVAMKTIGGPVSGEIVGSTGPGVDGGSVLQLEVNATGRGAVRLLEAPLQAIGRQWVIHQLNHLAATAASSPRSPE